MQTDWNMTKFHPTTDPVDSLITIMQDSLDSRVGQLPSTHTLVIISTWSIYGQHFNKWQSGKAEYFHETF